MSNAAINIFVQIVMYTCVFISPGNIHASGIAGSYSDCMFNFFSNSRVFSKGAVAFYVPINSA